MGKVSEIAVEKIGVSYNGGDDAVNQFLQVGSHRRHEV
jgi:hypothetical protein